jgi:hypothetical protein
MLGSCARSELQGPPPRRRNEHLAKHRAGILCGASSISHQASFLVCDHTLTACRLRVAGLHHGGGLRLARLGAYKLARCCEVWTYRNGDGSPAGSDTASVCGASCARAEMLMRHRLARLGRRSWEDGMAYCLDAR